MSSTVHYRTMTDDDVDAVHALVAEARWTHRREDLAFFKRVGHGCVAINEAGTVVAAGMWWPYGDAVATIGMVIVTPASQGKGIGRRLMQQLIAAAGARAISLIATKAGKPLYVSMAFRTTAEITQHQGLAKSGRVTDDAAVRRAEARDRPLIHALDADATDSDRSLLLDALCEVGTISVLERGGKIVGFSVCRPFGRGHVVGPVVCANDADAIALVAPHVRAHAGRFLRVDTPRTDGPFADFLLDSGLENASRSAQMTLGRDRNGGSVRTYALASQALG